MSFSFDEWKKKSNERKKPSVGMGSFDSWKANRESSIEQPKQAVRTFDQFEQSKKARELDAQGPKSEKARQADADRFARGHVSPKSDQAKQADADRFAGGALAQEERRKEQQRQVANDRFAGRAMSDAGLIERPKVAAQQVQPKEGEKATILSNMLDHAKSQFEWGKPEEKKVGTGYGVHGMAKPEAHGIERGMFDRNNENDQLSEKFGANLRIGAGDVAGGLAGVSRWLLGPKYKLKNGGIQPEDRAITKGLNKAESFLSDGVEADYSKEFDFKTAITDPEFYATSVTRAIPQLATSLIPALGAAKLTTVIPKIKNLPKVYKTVIQSLGGAGAATTIDSAIEAGSVYDEAISRGFTEDDANSAANETFAKNFALTGGTTFGEFMLGLSPIGRGVKNLGKTVSVAARATGGAALEGFQEGAQEAISAGALGDDFSWTDPGTIEAMTIGAILGGGVTGGMAALTETSNSFSEDATIDAPMADIIERTVMKLPAPVREQYDNAVYELQEQGQSFEDAREIALEALAEQDNSIESLIQGTALEYVADKKLERETRAGVEVKKDGTVTTKAEVQPEAQQAATTETTVQQLPAPVVEQQQVVQPVQQPVQQEATADPQVVPMAEPNKQSTETAEAPKTDAQTQTPASKKQSDIRNKLADFFGVQEETNVIENHEPFDAIPEGKKSVPFDKKVNVGDTLQLNGDRGNEVVEVLTSPLESENYGFRIRRKNGFESLAWDHEVAGKIVTDENYKPKSEPTQTEQPKQDGRRVPVIDSDDIAVGNKVRLKGTKADAFVEVVDTSDKSTITVRNESGAEYQVGRAAVEEKLIQDKPSPKNEASKTNGFKKGDKVQESRKGYGNDVMTVVDVIDDKTVLVSTGRKIQTRDGERDAKPMKYPSRFLESVDKNEQTTSKNAETTQETPGAEIKPEQKQEVTEPKNEQQERNAEKLLEEYRKNPESFQSFYRGEIVPSGDGTQKNMSRELLKRDASGLLKGSVFDRFGTPEKRITEFEKVIVKSQNRIKKLRQQKSDLANTRENADERLRLEREIGWEEDTITNRTEMIEKEKKKIEETDRYNAGKNNNLLFLSSQKETAEAYANAMSEVDDKSVLPEGYNPTVFEMKAKFDKTFTFPKGENNNGVLDFDDLAKILETDLKIPWETVERILDNTGTMTDGEISTFRSFTLFRGENALLVPEYISKLGYDSLNYTEGEQDNFIVLDRNKVLYQHEWEGVQEQAKEEAPEVEKKPEPKPKTDESIPTNGMDRISWFRKKLSSLDYTATDVKEQFEWVRDNEEQIKADIYDYIKKSEQHKRKRETTKQELVKKTYERALEQPSYADTDALTYRVVFGSVAEQEAGHRQQLIDKVNSISDESIKKHLDSKKAERDNKEKAKKNPETIQEFVFKKNTVGLTPEEQARLDELQALSQRERQIEKKEVAPVAESIQKGGYMIKPDKDTRDGSDIWVVSLKEKVDAKEYAEVNKAMKALGGYYSRYKKGFLFKEDPTAKLEGEVTETEVVETGGRDATRIAERLRGTAENMQKTIDEKRNDNRLTNTARRAQQDAYAREEADALERQQGIMRRIAAAIESGEAVFLDNVTARTHIETLDRVVNQAYRDRMNKKEYEKLSSKQRDEIAKQPLTEEEINAIDIPKVQLYPGNVERIVRTLVGTKDAKGISRELGRLDKALNANKGRDSYLNGDSIREDMLKVADRALKNEDTKYYAQSIKDSYDTVKRLEAMNLATPQLLRSGIREYIKYVDDVGENTDQKRKDEKRKREAELSKLNIPGFFPTPIKVIDRMLEEADIQKGMTVLEPSAGKGNIAERIRGDHEGVALDVVEYNNTLSEYLSSQDFNVVGSDFLEFEGTYDRILMNPPFEKGQDIDHVRRAYEMLEPGGRVVAIMSEGPFFRSDKKATEFRDWLEEHDGVSEPLEDGSFIDSERSTGVATRLVTIDKPAGITVEKAKPIPKVVGTKGETFTEKGTKVEFVYRLVEADELITSNNTDMKVNKDYPQELQPRDRSRKSSQDQIQGIAQKLNPNLLGESAKASDGAPIVGPDGVVESGNGRTIALKKVYADNMPKESDYRSWLLDNADKYGLDYADLENMNSPILVRQRTNEVDRQAFVEEANESNVAAMSATEQAKADAAKLTNRVMHLFNPAENGDLNVTANRPFITAFIGEVASQNDRGRLVTANGDLSQEGLLRVRNAVFAKAYGDVDAISLISESTDNNVRTVTNAMLQAAPRFAVMKDQIAEGTLHNLDVTAEIVEAMTQLAALRVEGVNVETFINQLTMFDSVSDLAKDMLTIFDSKKFKRSTKAVNELFNQYVDVLEVSGNPQQESLFGDTVPTKAEILQTALRRVTDDAQIDLFQDAPESSSETGTTSRAKGQKEKVNSRSEHVDTFINTKGSGRKQANRETFREPKGAPEDGKRKEYSQDPDNHDESVKRSDIIQYIQKEFKVRVDVGKTGRQAGIYKNKFAIIRTKNYGDFEVTTHELGHRIDTRLGLSVNPKLQAELVKFAEANLELPEGLTKIQRAREGVAEYFRQAFYGTHNFDLLTEAELKDVIAFNQVSPELELAIVDGLHQQGWFDKTVTLRGMMQSWLGRTPEQEVKGFVAELGGGRKQRMPFKRALNVIYANLFERDHPFYMAVREVEREVGQKIPLNESAYALKVLTRGTIGRAATFIEGRTFDKDGNVTGESLEAILADVGDIEEFGQYLAARQAMDLIMIHGKEKTPISVDLGADYLEDMNPKYEKQAKRVYAYQDRLLQVLVDGGLIPADLPAQLKEKYPNYVPFYREMSNSGVKEKDSKVTGGGRGVANLQQGIKHMSKDGSSRNVINPIESIVRNTHLYFSLADRNAVGKALAALADPESEYASEAQKDIIEEVPNSFKVTEFALEQIEKNLLNAGIEQEILEEIDMKEQVKLFNPIFKPNTAQNEVLIWKDGKPKLYKIHDTMLYNEMIMQENNASNGVIEFLGTVAKASAKVQRQGITASPLFTIRVFYRSFMQFMVKTDANWKNYLWQPARTVKAMYSVNKKNDLFWDWMASGGAQSTFIAVENEYLERKMNNYALNRKTKDVLMGRRKAETLKEKREIAWYLSKQTTLAPFRGLQRFNETLDQALKLAEYEVIMIQTGDRSKAKSAYQEVLKQTGDRTKAKSTYQRVLRQTGDRTKAALASREADVDYRRVGNKEMQYMNQITPFFNVSFQGPDNVIRAGIKHPLRTLLRASAWLILPTVLLYLKNRDDEDYQELNSWEKDMNWLIKQPNGKFLKIRVPFETGIFFKTIPEKLLGNYLDSKRGEDKQSWDGFYENSAKTMLPSFLPTIFDVPAKYNAEKDLANGRPFVPLALQRLEVEEQYDDNTSEVMKWIGKKTGKSPMVLEETFRAQFADVGLFFLHGSDVLLNAAGVIDKPGTKGLKDGFVERYNYASIDDGGTGSLTDFYENFNKYEKQYNTIVANFGDPGDQLESTVEMFKEANQDISRLRKLRNEMMFDKMTHPDGTKFTKEERKRYIDIANIGMRDTARVVQGKAALDEETMKLAWQLSDEYKEYQKGETKIRSEQKKARKKRRKQGAND